MANQKFKDTLLSVLKADERLWQDGEFNQTRLFDLADKHDAVLLKLLIDNEELKEKFFVKVNDIFIFKGQDFKFFLDENKLDNSYTQFENIIGLKIGNKMLKDRDEVVLNFPFKDCVLQGGQSRDEGLDIGYEYNEKLGDYVEVEAKRKEVFFNEILAKDEIDRLEAPKVLKNWKRYTKDGEVPAGSLKRDEDGVIKENLIIKGNNLLALHSIKKEFAGKVKLIYIDPPYNTGSDSFKYNDNFNHSAWLTFMKNRLEIAKDLLSDDGLIFIQIDTSKNTKSGSPELFYLGALLDEIFLRKNFIGNLHWKKKKQPSFLSKIAGVMEQILIYAKNEKMVGNLALGKTTDATTRIDNASNKLAERLIKKGISYKGGGDMVIKKGLYQNKTMTTEFLEDIVIKDGIVINDFRAIAKFRNTQDEITRFCDEGLIYITNNFSFRRYKDKSEINSEKTITDLLLDWGQNQDATDELRELFDIKDDTKIFDNPKPELLISNIINCCTYEDDVILDYHLGSGTTAAVAHKMGRQYIGIEQMDYIEPIAVHRMKKVIAGEQGGISKAVNWEGGGEFVYFELAEWNEEAKQKIQNANSIEELERLFHTMYERYFLNYNIKVKEFKEKVLIDAKFRNLPLDRQKDMFIRMLDLNQMYVNFTERNDKKFGISDDDISLSEEFYKN